MISLIRYSAVSDVGCVRTNNEDIAYVAGRVIRDDSTEGEVAPVSSPAVGFAVADGMGGYEGGEVASEIVARSFAALMKDYPAADTEHDTIRVLKDWARRANQLVLETAGLRPELAEMGTTFVGLVFASDRLWLINIGDSRCYRLRHGILKQLSKDHSERERTGNPDVPSNLIYNFMGNLPEDFISDVSQLNPLEGDLYILCSDGLSDLVDPDVIETSASSPEELVRLAKEAGGRDNVTVVTVKI